MIFFKLPLLAVSIIILLSLSGNNELQAQSNKKILTIEDVKLWRNHSVTLSDSGNWYTVLYSLSEKPESKKDSTKENSDKKKKNPDFYGKDNETDILYICHSEGGVKYQVTDGSNPVFSSASDWIAYQVKKETESKKEKKEKDEKTIELKNLKTGYTVQYKSNAEYKFAEDKNYFITSDENSLLIYGLDNRREHYIGNIGEYLIDKKSDYIAYTISSEDKRGNGIYLYNLKNMTTMALQTGNFIFSNLSWNNEKTALAAYKYNKLKKKVDYINMSIVVVSGINSDNPESFEYLVKDFQGMPDNMGPAVKFAQYSNKITWSNDGERLFIKIKEYDQNKEKKGKKDKESKEGPTVDVWHWKDKKLLSQRMMEEKRKKNEVYDAIFFLKSKKIVQLSSKEIQDFIVSEGTDNWAVGTDNREYISDWDVSKDDLYRINLLTGDKKLFEKKYSGIVEMSPDGEKIILWDGEHYWYYNLKDDSKYNITSGMDESFVDKENDLYGYIPDYGFVGWVKDQNAVIVNHKLDLWLLPLDGSSKTQNLTESVTSKDSIRFRFDDMSFTRKPEIDERYIDLSSPNILYAFNIKTKYAGYYQLQNGQLKELIYKPASYSSSRWRSGLIKAEKSDAVIYKMGNYQNYPEAYLSNLGFSNSKKITNTNS